MNLLYPTENHQEYISYITDLCNIKKLSLLLKGSLSTGTAKEFSDIDLVVCGNLTGDNLDDIITGYNKIVMTNYTVNPKGICILNYENGISVDLDIRQTVTSHELDSSMILSDFGFSVSETAIRKETKSKYLPDRPQWYQTLRLIHRCCVKYLCGKSEAADGLKQEVLDAVGQCCEKKPVYQNEMKSDLIAAFRAICDEFPVKQPVISLFEDLFHAMG
jgi:hypothetical protein